MSVVQLAADGRCDRELSVQFNWRLGLDRLFCSAGVRPESALCLLWMSFRNFILKPVTNRLCACVLTRCVSRPTVFKRTATTRITAKW